MNESVFGQYSVFCVFGSVVGCVVVPFIAKVLQQQVRNFFCYNGLSRTQSIIFDGAYLRK